MAYSIKESHSGVKEALIAFYAKSHIIYFATPLVAAGLWDQRQVEVIESNCFRNTYMLPHDIKGSAITNIARNQKPAWNVVERLSQKPRYQLITNRELSTP